MGELLSTQTSVKKTLLRSCRRAFTSEEVARGRRKRLQDVRIKLQSELQVLEAAGSMSRNLRCRDVFERLGAFVRQRGNELAPWIGLAFQFVIWDAGSEGKFFLDLRPGYCCAWYGMEPTVDCTVQTSDADIEA